MCKSRRNHDQLRPNSSLQPNLPAPHLHARSGHHLRPDPWRGPGAYSGAGCGHGVQPGQHRAHPLCRIGLSAILASSATAFTLVKVAGGIYLIYLGFKLWTADPALILSAQGEQKTARLIFRQSILANLLNPKVAIFFLAFFPQFVRPDQGHPTLQMVILGLTFVVLTMLGFGLVAFGAGALNSKLAARPSLTGWLHKGAGAILMLLGLRLIWADR